MPRGTPPVIGTPHYPSQLGAEASRPQQRYEAWAAGTPAAPEPTCAGSADTWSGDAALPCPAVPGTRCRVYL